LHRSLSKFLPELYVAIPRIGEIINNKNRNIIDPSVTFCSKLFQTDLPVVKQLIGITTYYERLLF
jgi:hypothetical protein